MLHTRPTAFLLFFMTLSTLPSTPQGTDNMIVQVKYSRHPIRRAEGQPLTLKCIVEYEEKHCGNISAFWCLSVPEMSCQALSDPDRYLIHIKEPELKRETVFRQQDVLVAFIQLTYNDTGFYQCKAICQHTGATAMGHLINVTVTGQEKKNSFFADDTKKGLKTEHDLNQSDHCSVNMFLLIISVFFLLNVITSIA